MLINLYFSSLGVWKKYSKNQNPLAHEFFIIYVYLFIFSKELIDFSSLGVLKTFQNTEAPEFSLTLFLFFDSL